MKYLETKHEKNSAKITTLIVVILVLLCFVVGQSYQDPPEEYGVAINFGNASAVNENSKPSNAEELQEFEPEPEKTSPEEIIEEEAVEEEVIDEETLEELESQAEALAEQEAAEAAAAEKAAEAEKLLLQEAEEALKIKEEKEAAEAKKAAEALEKEKKAASEAKDKAEREAKAKQVAEAKAKKAAQAKRALEAKKKAEKAASDAKKAEEARIAKAKAEAASKKAAADAAAAQSATKGNNSGNQTVSFALIENVPIFPGCEGGNNAARKACMNQKIKQFLSDNFNKKLPSELGLSGVQKINIFFKINEQGNVVSIRAKAPNAKLADEAKRVTNLLPKMKPGMQQGRPVAVSFYLPLSINAN